MLLSTRSNTPWPSLRRSTVVGTILRKHNTKVIGSVSCFSKEHDVSFLLRLVVTVGLSPLVVALLPSGLRYRPMVVRRTDVLNQWDEGALWGDRMLDRLLHRLMGMGRKGLRDVLGAQLVEVAGQRQTAPDRLRVTTAYLLPLPVLQQWDLRWTEGRQAPLNTCCSGTDVHVQLQRTASCHSHWCWAADWITSFTKTEWWADHMHHTREGLTCKQYLQLFMCDTKKKNKNTFITMETTVDMKMTLYASVFVPFHYF